MQSHSEYTQTIKVVLIGDANVGKSSLYQHLIEEKPNPLLDVGIKKMEVNGEVCKVEIWDCPSIDIRKEKYPEDRLAKSYAGAQGFVLLYDITNKESFENIERWMKTVKYERNFKFVLVGTKSDLNKESKVDSSTAIAFAEKHKMQFFEISVKNNVNLNKFFEAFIQEIGKAFIIPSTTLPKVKEEAKKAIDIDTSNPTALKDFILKMVKEEISLKELKQFGKNKKLKKAILEYLEKLEKPPYQALDEILSFNKKSRRLNEFFNVKRLVSFSLFGGTIIEFTKLEQKYIARTKFGEAKEYYPEDHKASAPSSLYDGPPPPQIDFPAPSAPPAPSDAKTLPSLDDLSIETKSYVEDLIKRGKTIAGQIAELNLTPEEEAFFKGFLDPVFLTYIKFPVSIHETYFDIYTLLREKQNPFTRREFKPIEIQTGRRLFDKLDKAKEKLKIARAKTSEPEPQKSLRI